MKFTIDIDCTPEEARAFFGLPPVAGLQEEMLKQIQTRMSEYLKGADFTYPHGQRAPEDVIELIEREG